MGKFIAVVRRFLASSFIGINLNINQKSLETTVFFVFDYDEFEMQEYHQKK